jgi:hypothetical protein
MASTRYIFVGRETDLDLHGVMNRSIRAKFLDGVPFYVTRYRVRGQFLAEFDTGETAFLDYRFCKRTRRSATAPGDVCGDCDTRSRCRLAGRCRDGSEIGGAECRD